MLNKDTQNVLKSLTTINNQMIISNKMTGCDEFKTILFKANLDKIDDIPEEFGIFDTTNFLNALELLEDPEITLDGNLISAKDQNTQLEFLTSNVGSLDDVQIDVKTIDTTVAAPSVLEFTFNNELSSKIRKASSVFKTFDTLWIVNGRTTELKLGTKNSFSKSNNAFKIQVTPEVQAGQDFNIALPIDSLMKVPSMDYKFAVKYNEKRDAYRVVLSNELLTLVMSLQKD